MIIKILPAVLCILSIVQGLKGQEEKIRGNKIVVSDYREIEGFHSIVISKDIVALLEENCQNKIEIETDENLIPIITTTVADSILTITTNKEITNSKVLTVRISHTETLQRIIINDKVELKSTAPIHSNNLWFEANNNAKSFITISSDNFNGIFTGKSNADIHLERGNAQIEVHDNAKLKGLIIADTLNVELSLKAKANLEGEIKNATVHAKHNTDFYGEKLACNQLTVHAEGDSDCHLFTNTTLHLEARNASEVYLYGNPSINIVSFADKAIFYKKEMEIAPE